MQVGEFSFLKAKGTSNKIIQFSFQQKATSHFLKRRVCVFPVYTKTKLKYFDNNPNRAICFIFKIPIKGGSFISILR